MTDQPMPLRVTVYFDGKRLREVTFDRAIVNVGKHTTSNLRLDDVNVSRKHTVIERRDNGQWRITDLGSTNGTLVNGRRVTQAILQDGDRVLLGETTLVIGILAKGFFLSLLISASSTLTFQTCSPGSRSMAKGLPSRSHRFTLS